MPVAHANARSPSWRVCDGWMARARPWWALRASRWHSTFVQRALVATTTSVVLVRPPASSNGAGSGKPGHVGRRLRAGEQACRRRDTSPTALTTTSAATTTSPSRADAVPSPPVRAVLGAAPLRRRCAPRPAPTRPVASGGASGSSAAASAARPSSGAGTLVARDHEVEDRRRRHDRHRATAVGKPAALLGERPHHAVGGGEPERRPAGEHDRVDVLDRGERVEHRGLARRRRARRGSRPTRRCSGGNTTTVTPVAVAGPVPGSTPGTSVITSAAPRRRRSRRPVGVSACSALARRSP